jgi:hypothetical protein
MSEPCTGTWPLTRVYVLLCVYPAPENPWRWDEHARDTAVDEEEDPHRAETFVEGVFSHPDRALAHLHACVGDAEVAWLPSDEVDPRTFVTAVLGDEVGRRYYECRGYALDWCDWQALVTSLREGRR